MDNVALTRKKRIQRDYNLGFVEVIQEHCTLVQWRQLASV